MEADPSFQKVVGSLDRNKSKICTHCHTSITSLWRNGPFGRKSLCNACGLRYRRKGLEAPESDSKGDKGKNRRGMDQIQYQSTVIKGNNGKKKTKSKGPEEVDMRSMLKTIGCRKEMMLPQIQQHGVEVVKAAVQLMNLSSATIS